MLSFELYKRIYKKSRKDYLLYAFECFKHNLKKYTVGVVKSTYLCIRFPFLYPRNIWSGKHWSSRRLDDVRYNLYNKWSNYAIDHKREYYDKFGPECICLFGEHVDIYTDPVLERGVVSTKYVMKGATLWDRMIYKLVGGLNAFLSIFHCIPTYSLYDDIPTGWKKRFGLQFCKELKKAILHSGGRKLMRDFRIEDIKEKYGTFRCYISFGSDEINRVIEKYEYISQFVCIECGEDAVKVTQGYISPYCEKHIPEAYGCGWLWINPIYGYSDIGKENENKKKIEEFDNFLKSIRGE